MKVTFKDFTKTLNSMTLMKSFSEKEKAELLDAYQNADGNTLKEAAVAMLKAENNFIEQQMKALAELSRVTNNLENLVTQATYKLKKV